MLDERRQSLLILGSLAACTALTVSVHGILETTAWVTHAYYFPVLLGSLWWGRRSLLVPVYLSVLLLASSVLFSSTQALVDNGIRVGLLFLVYAAVSYVVQLGRREQHARNAIKRSFGTLARARLGMLQQDNAVLLESVGQRASANASPEASAELNELLVSEISSRMTSNLQIVDSLLGFASDSRGADRSSPLLEDADGRRYTMTRIHEALSQSQRTECLALEAFLEGLVDHLVATYATVPIRVELNVRMKDLPRDIAIPIGLAVNELVVNALKHAFIDMPTGTLTIEAHTKDGVAEVVVRDDGIGLPEDALRRNSRGAGLALVSSMVEELEGRIEVFYEPGSMFLIRVPLRSSCSLR